MPNGMTRPALLRRMAGVAALWIAAGCTPLSYQEPSVLAVQPTVGQGSTAALVTDLGRATLDTQLLIPPPGADTCGHPAMPVVRSVFAERVLFATASDEPAPGAAGVLKLLADRVRRDAPGSDLTVLGHTDSVGSDAYNMELSQHRAERVLRELAGMGLDPAHLSAVAIGKRQPVAANNTAEGRAENRRVEFLISGCLAANLAVVRGHVSAAGDLNVPVEVMRLDPLSPYGLARAGTIALRQPSGDQAGPATMAPGRILRPPALAPAATVARPAQAPHYQPKTLSPDAQPSPLGPAVPF